MPHYSGQMDFFTEKSVKLQIISTELYKSSYVLGLIINNTNVSDSIFKNHLENLGQKDLIKNRK